MYHKLSLLGATPADPRDDALRQLFPGSVFETGTLVVFLNTSDEAIAMSMSESIVATSSHAASLVNSEGKEIAGFTSNGEEQAYRAAYRDGFEKARALGHDHREAHEWGARTEMALRNRAR